MPKEEQIDTKTPPV
jgi:26S proteasome regulatory subunit T1